MYICSRCDEQIIAENVEQAMLDGRVPNSERMSRCPFCREGTEPSVGRHLDCVTTLLMLMYALCNFFAVSIFT